MAVQVNDLLAIAVERKSSDLHLKVGSPPIFRINGTLVQWEEVGVLDHDSLSVLTQELLSDSPQSKRPARQASRCPSSSTTCS